MHNYSKFFFVGMMNKNNNSMFWRLSAAVCVQHQPSGFVEPVTDRFYCGHLTKKIHQANNLWTQFSIYQLLNTD